MPDPAQAITAIQVYLLFGVNLIVVIGGIGKGISILISVRDQLHDMSKNIGAQDPPSGLLGDVKEMKREARYQRDTLIEVTSELGLRPPGGRS